MSKPYLSIIIPAYNEAARIGKTIESILHYFQKEEGSAIIEKRDFEILVVDDGSMDTTAKVVRKFDPDQVNLIQNGINRGKGFSVKNGVLHSNGELILFTDADLSTPIHQFAKLYQAFQKGKGIVIGSRGINRDLIKVHQPFYRETMGKIFNIFVRLLVLNGIRDTQCGFKLFPGELARDIFSNLKIERFSFDVEALYLVRLRGVSIMEIPVEWVNDTRTTVRVIRDSWRMLRDLFRIKRMH